MTEQPGPGDPTAPGGFGPPAASGYWGPAPEYAQPAPGYPGQRAPWYDPNDPLVNPPGAGLSGWFERVAGAVRRSWRVLLATMLITQFLPAVVLSLAVLWLFQTWSPPTVPATPDDPPQLPEGFWADVAVFAGVSLVGLVVYILLQSAGWAAGIWAITRRAAGQPAPLGAALAYGLRRAPGLLLWTLLSGLIVMVGVVMCIAPGIYFAFALSLVGPVFLFERRNPIGRSFGLFHGRFGMVLGRLALLAAAVVAGWLGGIMLGQLGQISTARVPLGPVDVSAGGALATLLSALLDAALAVVLLAGLLVTYVEQRGHEGRATAATLAAELG